MREIVLDTETTGLDPNQGHRLVEIGCVELLNRIPTGATFHVYINPERDMPAEAFDVHGLSAEFLKRPQTVPRDRRRIPRLHRRRAAGDPQRLFDLGFLCAELKRAERTLIARDRLVDTLMLARRKHPAGPNNLDDLCARYGIDNSHRTKHGALLDAELLAEVYLELIGARQASLGLADAVLARATDGDGAIVARQRPAPLAPRVTDAERAAHRAFIATLGETAIWRQYAAGDEK